MAKVLVWEDGVQVVRDAMPGELESVLPDIEEERAYALRQVIGILASAQEAVTGQVTPAEMASWPSKADAARGWLADQTKAVPTLIAGEATLRSKTPLQVATRIAQKADAWEVVIAAHTGLRGNAEEAIAAAATPEEVRAALTALRAALI
jgi:hypothetical protein